MRPRRDVGEFFGALLFAVALVAIFSAIAPAEVIAARKRNRIYWLLGLSAVIVAAAAWWWPR